MGLDIDIEQEQAQRWARAEAAITANRQRGHCQLCGRSWTAEQSAAVCGWCGKSSKRVASQRKGRSEPRKRPIQHRDTPLGLGYADIAPQGGWIATEKGFLWGEWQWATYYRIGVRFAMKALSGEKDDLLHTIMEALAVVHRRKLSTGQDFTEPAMYRTAEHVKDWYWHKHYAYNNGLDCRHCTKEQRGKCRWNWGHTDWAYCDCHRAIQLESINQQAVDEEGNPTELIELIADDNATDLDEWLDIKIFLIGAPIRLKAIVKKRKDGETLTGAERKYLAKLRKRQQLSLVKG